MRWAIVAGVALWVGAWCVVAWMCGQSSARRERKAIEEAGLTVTRERDDLSRELAEASRGSAELRLALARAEAAVPGLKATAVRQASTGPIVTYDPCLSGRRLELKVAEVDLRAPEGTRALAGAIEARDADTGQLLAAGAFDPAKTASWHEPEQARAGPPAWGFGGAVFAAPGQPVAYGPAISPPPLRLWRLQFELYTAVGLGRGGPQGVASVLTRWVAETR